MEDLIQPEPQTHQIIIKVTISKISVRHPVARCCNCRSIFIRDSIVLVVVSAESHFPTVGWLDDLEDKLPASPLRVAWLLYSPN
ncbi:hypothetical protein EYF80_021669 [Liparis tanakae]|uniref:Uncharacterized protein n=1 Tax=Liparis tanakae TaxID=230148 RepID=A0A4Z2HQR4_9TELE|nr:hypothetical protein EYF80_021669 [Liparis tanakae]